MNENEAVVPVGAPVGGITERNPNSLANLRPPWRKGQSGNPSGKPKGLFPVRIRRKLKREIGKDENGERILAVDPLIDAAIEHAKTAKGLGHLEFLADHADGPLPRPSEAPAVERPSVIVLPSWSSADKASRPKE